MVFYAQDSEGRHVVLKHVCGNSQRISNPAISAIARRPSYGRKLYRAGFRTHRTQGKLARRHASVRRSFQPSFLAVSYAILGGALYRIIYLFIA